MKSRLVILTASILILTSYLILYQCIIKKTIAHSYIPIKYIHSNCNYNKHAPYKLGNYPLKQFAIQSQNTLKMNTERNAIVLQVPIVDSCFSGHEADVLDMDNNVVRLLTFIQLLIILSQYG